jgi:hypothetical protein
MIGAMGTEERREAYSVLRQLDIRSYGPTFHGVRWTVNGREMEAQTIEEFREKVYQMAQDGALRQRNS